MSPPRADVGPELAGLTGFEAFAEMTNTDFRI